MRLGDLLKRLLGGRAERRQLPEVLGTITDDQGQRHEVHRGWRQHVSLSETQMRRVAHLREILAEPYPMTMEGWVDGFLRDVNPESEIRIIEACANVYQKVTSQAELSLPEKKRLYAVLCALSAGGADSELASALPVRQDLPSIESLRVLYRQALNPGGGL